MRCLTCSDGIATPGAHHCYRCQPTPTPAPEPITETELRRRTLTDSERQLIGSLSRNYHTAAERARLKTRLDDVRTQLATLDQAVTA